MFFSKEIVQNEANVLYDDKEILDVLNAYHNDSFSRENQIGTDREKMFKLINNYCNKFYKNCLVSTLEEDFYNKFLLLFMPSYSLTLTEKEIKIVLNELSAFMEYINESHGIDLYKSYRKNFSANVDEILRVYYILRKIQKYTEACVLSFNPMIIDMNCYKKRKKAKEVSKREMYEQGHFEIIDKIGGIIILKKSKLNSANSYIKIKVENSLASDMRCKDIINMRIKKRFFYTTWDIIDVKDYYSYKISKYID
ncbi:hypothetical protein SH1V18_11800 [Vallitalea longa]|uniref:Uncharacterized protein n=1 Tax=Vallitalea longa TaxID=2936439 RepID=A0A9W5Y9U4_9FIRM|nr:hypothetical protein [Vallitalea longa]GKX28700.1 hypothetical protein SH1V18_11800 [Vallitalea longa]